MDAIWSKVVILRRSITFLGRGLAGRKGMKLSLTEY